MVKSKNLKKMKKQITLKEMSENLGYSISTISKALNDSPEISNKTKEKIKNAAINHNYIPNFFAKNLKNETTNIIRVNMRGIDEQICSVILKEVVTASRLNDFEKLEYQINSEHDIENVSNRNFINGKIMGIIVLISDA